MHDRDPSINQQYVQNLGGNLQVHTIITESHKNLLNIRYQYYAFDTYFCQTFPIISIPIISHLGTCPSTNILTMMFCYFCHRHYTTLYFITPVTADRAFSSGIALDKPISLLQNILRHFRVKVSCQEQTDCLVRQSASFFQRKHKGFIIKVLLFIRIDSFHLIQIKCMIIIVILRKEGHRNVFLAIFYIIREQTPCSRPAYISNL